MTGAILRELFDLWRVRNMSDEYIGTLVNAWLANDHEAWGIRAGEAYVDVGTLHGYREAIKLLAAQPSHTSPLPQNTFSNFAAAGIRSDVITVDGNRWESQEKARV